jgi:zinc D-Ala-D-Ala carboxypeptidase
MSQHFKPEEFKCPHCFENKISLEFIDRLEEVRKVYGKPMAIVSGYRCPAHNAAVGGVDSSAHTEGLAADIACSFAGDRMRMVEIAIGEGFRRIGIGRTFLHIDISTTLPQNVIWLY